MMRALNALLAQSAQQGALPQLYAATAPDVSGGDFVGPDGWMGMRGHPRKVTAKETAYDEEPARELWQVSGRTDRRKCTPTCDRGVRSPALLPVQVQTTTPVHSYLI